MKATHIDNNTPVAYMSIKFSYTAFHLEQVIIYMLCNKEKITKKRIREWLEYSFHCGGQSTMQNWNHEDDSEAHEETAKEISKKLFPTFYKTTQQ